MLSVMAGADDRSPISYDVDTRELARAAKAPSVKGWRIAWTADLGGLVLVDDEVRTVFERAVAVFRARRRARGSGVPDMSDVPEIVRLTRGLLMVARHADKLPEHRAVLQEGLVENTEQGLALTVARRSRAASCSARASGSGCASFLGDARPADHADVGDAAVPAREPALRSTASPWARLQRSYLTYAFSVLGLPAISIPCGFTRDGLPVGLQIVGRRRGEAAVLRAAAAFEAAQPWADGIPPVARRPC